MGSAIFKWLSIAVILCVTVMMAVRQLQFVDRYSSNVMCSDQWELYPPIFAHASVWKLFTFQHGPHRQGVGFLITPLLARWSGCNTRWDAFAVSYTMIIACVLGIILSVRCGVHQPIALVAVPLMYLTTREYESFAAGSNISHGAMPMLLFTAMCLCWFIQNQKLRITLVSLLTFGLIFTGFGIFVGLLTPLVLSLEAFQSWQEKRSGDAVLPLVGLLACAISWWLFSIGYVFDPTNATFHFPYEHPMEYLYFMAQMLVNFYTPVDQQPWILPLGFLLITCLLAICVIHARRAIRGGALQERPSVVIFLLSAFTLIYCLNTAVGRVSLGWQTASLASRYVILMVPAGMAIFLHVATVKSPLYSVAIPLIFAVLLAPGALQLSPGEYQLINILYAGKIAWRDACLATRDEERANETSNFEVYPVVGFMKDSLKYIEVHHLNFFKDAPPATKP